MWEGCPSLQLRPCSPHSSQPSANLGPSLTALPSSGTGAAGLCQVLQHACVDQAGPREVEMNHSDKSQLGHTVAFQLRSCGCRCPQCGLPSPQKVPRDRPLWTDFPQESQDAWPGYQAHWPGCPWLSGGASAGGHVVDNRLRKLGQPQSPVERGGPPGCQATAHTRRDLC